MPNRARPIPTYILSFLIAAIFLYFAFQGVKLSELWSSIKNVNYWWIALLIPINILSHWFRAIRWAHLLSPIKTNTSKRNLFSAVMIGYAVNNILPRVGEFVRPYVIGKLEGISKTSSFGTVVVERIIDLISFYFIACIVLFISPHSLDPFIRDVEVVRPLFLLGSVVTFLILVILFFKAEVFFRTLAKLLHFAPKKFALKIEKMLEKFYSGFAVSKVKSKFIIIAVYSFSIFGFYALGMYIPFFAFAEIQNLGLDFGSAVLLLVITSISWLLPAPGAVGTYHSFITVAMVKLYNIDIATALSFALITHGIGYFLSIILGTFFYFTDNLKLNEITSVKSDTEI